MAIAKLAKIEVGPNTALIDSSGAVWACVSAPWWDLATWIWWLLAPSSRRRWAILKGADGTHFRSRAIRIADKHVRIVGI